MTTLLRTEQRLATVWREATIQRADVEGDDGDVTFEAVYSTGAAVRRWDWDYGEFYEELSIDPAHIRAERLNSGAFPILKDHRQSVDNLVGVVTKHWITAGKAYVQFRMARGTPDVDAVLNKVQQGILKSVSVGYRVHKFLEDRADGKIPKLTAVDWEPLEISLVAVPADAGATVRSEDANPSAYPCEIIRANPTISTGENSMALPVNPSETAPAPVPTEVRAGPVDASRQIADALNAERTRTTEIRALGRKHSIDEATVDGFIANGSTLETASRAVLDILAERSAAAPTNAVRAQVQHSYDDPAVIRSAIVDSLVAKTSGVRAEGKATEFMARTMLESFGELLQARGERVQISRSWLVERALHTTSDFPVMLATAMHRVVQNDYAAAPSTYQRIGRRHDFMDFREHEFLRGSEFPELLDLGEGGEIKSGTINDAKTEVVRLSTRARKIAVSRELLINDQLGYIAQHLGKYGRRIAAQENKIAWDLIKANPKMKWDNKAVFHADHGNLHGSNVAAPDAATLSLIRAALRKHESEGIPLNFGMKTLIVDEDLETDAQKLRSAILASTTGNVNVFAGAFEILVERNVHSHNAWYGATDPADAEVLVYGYLNGATGPMVDTKPGWDTYGAELRIGHDFGVGITGEKGIYKVKKS